MTALIAFDLCAAHLVKKEKEPPVPENVAKGDLPIEIKQKDHMQPDQKWRSGNSFDNCFYNNLAIFNPLEKDVAIVSVKSEYEKDGQWIEMPTR